MHDDKRAARLFFYRSAGVLLVLGWCSAGALLVFCWRSAGARYTRVEAGKSCSEAGSLFIYKYPRSWKFIDS